MIDFPTFDLILLGLIIFSYVLRGGGSRLVLHDPLSALAAPAIAEAAAIPEVASVAALPAIAGAADIGAVAGGLGAGGLGAADVFGAAAPAAAASSIAGDLGAGGLFGSAVPGAAEAALVPSSLTGPLMQTATGLEATVPASTQAAPLFGDISAGALTGSPGAALVPGGALDIAGQAPGAALSPASLAGPSDVASAAPASADVSAATPASTAATSGVAPTGVSGSNWPSWASQWPSGTTGTTAATATSGVGDWLGKNWDKLAKAGISGLGLMMAGNQKPQFNNLPGEAQLQQAAGEAQSNAQALGNYQLSGTLPPGMQQIVDANNASSKAAIRSQYAHLGYSGSTAEKQALAQVDQASAAQIAMLANNLAKQGLSWANISSQDFNALMNQQWLQEQAYQSALGKFASGLASVFG